MLSNEIIVRDPKQRGRLLTGDDTAIEVSSLQSTMSLLNEPPKLLQDRADLHHLMVEVKGLSNHGRDSPVLFMYLCSKAPGEPPKQLTESFSIEVPLQDQFNKAVTSGKMRTLFTDLTSIDIGESSGSDVQLYLVVKVQTNQLTNPASLTPSKSGASRESTFARNDSPGTISPAVSSSAKSARRSMMWATSKLGSQRQRQPSGSKPESSTNTLNNVINILIFWRRCKCCFWNANASTC